MSSWAIFPRSGSSWADGHGLSARFLCRPHTVTVRFTLEAPSGRRRRRRWSRVTFRSRGNSHLEASYVSLSHCSSMGVSSESRIMDR
ncbi:hypothetical protein EYF80_048966 [Liparis tanakae]|uniref:Uncharacterized protein n=1 Tax=Liparis tanakae TaxID=230148 RepID=A0A4Z2FIT4_9TELE|nr:hypothetical protein EYF80_048966 [Liparis tanakae]